MVLFQIFPSSFRPLEVEIGLKKFIVGLVLLYFELDLLIDLDQDLDLVLDLDKDQDLNLDLGVDLELDNKLKF